MTEIRQKIKLTHKGDSRGINQQTLVNVISMYLENMLDNGDDDPESLTYQDSPEDYATLEAFIETAKRGAYDWTEAYDWDQDRREKLLKVKTGCFIKKDKTKREGHDMTEPKGIKVETTDTIISDTRSILETPKTLNQYHEEMQATGRYKDMDKAAVLLNLRHAVKVGDVKEISRASAADSDGSHLFYVWTESYKREQIQPASLNDMRDGVLMSMLKHRGHDVCKYRGKYSKKNERWFKVGNASFESLDNLKAWIDQQHEERSPLHESEKALKRQRLLEKTAAAVQEIFSHPMSLISYRYAMREEGFHLPNKDLDWLWEQLFKGNVIDWERPFRLGDANQKAVLKSLIKQHGGKRDGSGRKPSEAPKKQKGMRLSIDALDRLKALSEESGATETAILEGLLMGAEISRPKQLLIDKGIICRINSHQALIRKGSEVADKYSQESPEEQEMRGYTLI